MSTSYSIYCFAKPTKQELSKIEWFEPYASFSIYDAEGEQTDECIKLFRKDDEDIANILKSKFIKNITLPEKVTDYNALYKGLGFSEKAIAEKKIYMSWGNGYTFEYTDGEHTKRIEYEELQRYKGVVETECIAIKMECLWDSEDALVYPNKARVLEFIPELRQYSFAPINNSILSKAEIPFLIFERNKGKCFIKKY